MGKGLAMFRVGSLGVWGFGGLGVWGCMHGLKIYSEFVFEIGELLLKLCTCSYPRALIFQPFIPKIHPSKEPDSLRQRPKSGRPETTREIVICDCLPIVGLLLV
jgi:hypothetical protein